MGNEITTAKIQKLVYGRNSKTWYKFTMRCRFDKYHLNTFDIFIQVLANIKSLGKRYHHYPISFWKYFIQKTKSQIRLLFICLQWVPVNSKLVFFSLKKNAKLETSEYGSTYWLSKMKSKKIVQTLWQVTSFQILSFIILLKQFIHELHVCTLICFTDLLIIYQSHKVKNLIYKIAITIWAI